MRWWILILVLWCQLVLAQTATLVQTNICNFTVPANPMQCTFASPVTAGNFIHVSGTYDANGFILVPFTDSAGNNYITIDNDATGPSEGLSTAYAYNVIGGTITVNMPNSFSAIQNVAMEIDEYSGIHTSSAPLDTWFAETYQSCTGNLGTITTSYNNELIIGAIGTFGGSLTTFTAGTGFTLVNQYGITQIAVATEFKNQAVAGMISPTINIFSCGFGSSGVSEAFLLKDATDTQIGVFAVGP